ncbi:MAG TPA: response regulator [Thermodesulfobacteriota bacterium]|nr:response regulator [Thermodesulfobacteriota bacterium]
MIKTAQEEDTKKKQKAVGNKKVTRIMIVEDEKIVARDIQNTLKNFGYDVSAVVASGEDAIQKVREVQPDLVLMDIVLKGNMDGVRTARKIYYDFNIPVIYVTAYADEGTLNRVKKTEPFGYILKAFQVKELHSAIEIALYRHRTDKKLKQTKKHLASALSGINDGVIATDTGGFITFMNPVAEALTALKKERALGRHWSGLFKMLDEGVRSSVESLLATTLEKGVAAKLNGKAIITDKNGTENFIHVSVAPIEDKKGDKDGAVVVFRKIPTYGQPKERIKSSESPKSKIKLVLVSSAFTTEGITRILELEDDIQLISAASTYPEMVPLVERNKPDVLLIDTAIQDIDVKEVLEFIRKRSPKTKLLLLLHAIDESEAINILSLGVCGCLTDTSNKGQLVEAVRAVSKGWIWMDVQSISNILTRLLPLNNERLALRSKLTKREEEIVNLVVQGYSNKQISVNLFIAENTVKTHLANIFSKFEVTNRIQLIKKFSNL